MRVVAFLPAKGESSRIHNKNISLLDGKPLFLYTLEKLMRCSFIDQVYLDTESDEIISLASETGCQLLKRDPALATNKVDGNKLFMNEVHHVEADIYIQVLATSPFIKPDTIKQGLDLLTSGDQYDSAILVKKDKLYTWKSGQPEYDINAIPNSVDLEETVIETMGLYIVKRETALSTGRRIGNVPAFIEAAPIESVDVNYPEEFALANLIAAGLREQERKNLNNLKYLMTSSLLSDILDDLGYPNQVIKDLQLNLRHAHVLGRAKTLKLRKLEAHDRQEGIYDALQSYKTIIPDDVIVVESEASDYAYFGELNANLALRCGASAAIIGGKTRDSLEVERLGLPVFSKGVGCQDVRKRATTAYINKKITLMGVSVSPGELVFGDLEGVVVIPAEIEQQVIQAVIHRSSQEKRIISDISLGADVETLISDYGFF